MSSLDMHSSVAIYTDQAICPWLDKGSQCAMTRKPSRKYILHVYTIVYYTYCAIPTKVRLCHTADSSCYITWKDWFHRPGLLYTGYTYLSTLTLIVNPIPYCDPGTLFVNLYPFWEPGTLLWTWYQFVNPVPLLWTWYPFVNLVPFCEPGTLCETVTYLRTRYPFGKTGTVL